VAVNPDPGQIAELSALAGSDADGPVIMLNLNRYRERAAYEGQPPGGGDPDVPGREAYERYGEVALRTLERLGGRVLWHARSPGTVVGGGSERYDEVLAVYYPSLQAFLALALDPDILTASAHRTAGLEQATLIRCQPGLEDVVDPASSPIDLAQP
jgi:uncharacterized protein (DUF1330 family)